MSGGAASAALRWMQGDAAPAAMPLQVACSRLGLTVADFVMFASQHTHPAALYPVTYVHICASVGLWWQDFPRKRAAAAGAAACAFEETLQRYLAAYQ